MLYSLCLHLLVYVKRFIFILEIRNLQIMAVSQWRQSWFVHLHLKFQKKVYIPPNLISNKSSQVQEKFRFFFNPPGPDWVFWSKHNIGWKLFFLSRFSLFLRPDLCITNISLGLGWQGYQGWHTATYLHIMLLTFMCIIHARMPFAEWANCLFQPPPPSPP